MTQYQAQRWLFMHDYRISAGKVWYVTVDDMEYWEGIALAQWDSEDWIVLVELLREHQLPTSFLQCVECHDAEVTELGYKCDRCTADDAASLAGDRAVEMSK